MIKLVGVSLLYGTLICGMTGVAFAQSVPFYPTARQTNYDIGIPGTDDHVSASGHPEYNLSGEQQPAAAPAATKTAQHPTSTQKQYKAYPDFGSIAKTTPAGG